MPRWENLNDPPMSRERRKTQALQGGSPLSDSSITRGRLRIASDEGLLVEGIATIEGLIDVTGQQTVDGSIEVTGVQTVSGELRGIPKNGRPAKLVWQGPADFTGDVTARIFKVENGDFIALFNENGLRTEGKGVLITPGQPDRSFTYTQRMTHGGYEFTNSLGQSATLNPTGLKISDLPTSSSPESLHTLLINADGRFYRGPRYSSYGGGGGGTDIPGGGGGTGLQWPFPKSSVSSEFGPRARDDGWHNGRDFAQPAGTPIPAAGDGVVTASTFGSWQGNYVQIRHGYVGQTRIGTGYMHMSTSPAVSVGQSVSMGTILGPVGTTGDSDGNHLHLEFYENGARIDPRIGFERYQNSTFTANPT